MKKIVVCVMALSFALISYSASASFAATDSTKAQGLFAPHCITIFDMIKFMMNLKITETQKAAFKELKASTEASLKSIKAEMQTLQEEMNNVFLAADIDTAAAETLIDDMQTLQTQVSDILLHAELQAVQILTAEQRALLLAMVTKILECEKSRTTWLKMSKPAYFSLIMPDKIFAK